MISFCCTTYNRFAMTIDCFNQILNRPEISEVVISDDCSTDNSYEMLCNFFADNPKVKIFRNERNLDCALNKKVAIELATNDWCILADSDNIFGNDYLDSILDYSWREDVILQPEFAAPHFNFKEYDGLMIDKTNVAEYIDKPLFETMLNAQNFFVNRQSYLDVYEYNEQAITSDSIWFNYLWLKSGRKIYVMPKLSYTHRVHNGSHYQNNIYKMKFGVHQSILNKIRELK